MTTEQGPGTGVTMSDTEIVRRVRQWLNGSKESEMETRWLKRVCWLAEMALRPEGGAMMRIGEAWVDRAGAVWEFSADKNTEEKLGLRYVPVFIDSTRLSKPQVER